MKADAPATLGVNADDTRVRFEIVVDWKRAGCPPVVALRRILKMLGRQYGARCVREIVHPPEGGAIREKTNLPLDLISNL